jgi:hypothetical protein
MACLTRWGAKTAGMERGWVEKGKQGWLTAHPPVRLTRVGRASFLRWVTEQIDHYNRCAARQTRVRCIYVRD